MDKSERNTIYWNQESLTAKANDKIIVTKDAKGTLTVTGNSVLICGEGHITRGSIVVESGISMVTFEGVLTIKSVSNLSALEYRGKGVLTLNIRKAGHLTLYGSDTTDTNKFPTSGLYSAGVEPIKVTGNLTVFAGNDPLNHSFSTNAVQSNLSLGYGNIRLEGGYLPEFNDPVDGVIYIESEGVNLTLTTKIKDKSNSTSARIVKSSKLNKFYVHSDLPYTINDKDSITVRPTETGTFIKAGASVDYHWSTDSKLTITKPGNVYISKGAAGSLNICSNGVNIFGYGNEIEAVISTDSNTTDLTFCGELTVHNSQILEPMWGEGPITVPVLTASAKKLTMYIKSDGIGSGLKLSGLTAISGNHLAIKGGTVIFEGINEQIAIIKLIEGKITIYDTRVKLLAASEKPVNGYFCLADSSARLDVVYVPSLSRVESMGVQAIPIKMSTDTGRLQAAYSTEIISTVYEDTTLLNPGKLSLRTLMESDEIQWGSNDIEVINSDSTVKATNKSTGNLTISANDVIISSELGEGEFVTGSITIGANVTSLILHNLLVLHTSDTAITYLGITGDTVTIAGACPDIVAILNSSSAPSPPTRTFGLFGIEHVQELTLVAKEKHYNTEEVYGISCPNGGMINWDGGCFSSSISSNEGSTSYPVPFIPMDGNLIIKSGTVNLTSGSDDNGMALPPVTGSVTLDSLNSEFVFGSLGENSEKDTITIYNPLSAFYVEQDASLPNINVNVNRVEAVYPYLGKQEASYFAVSETFIWAEENITVYDNAKVSIGSNNCGVLTIAGSGVELYAKGNTITGHIIIKKNVSSFTVIGDLSITALPNRTAITAESAISLIIKDGTLSVTGGGSENKNAGHGIYAPGLSIYGNLIATGGEFAMSNTYYVSGVGISAKDNVKIYTGTVSLIAGFAYLRSAKAVTCSVYLMSESSVLTLKAPSLNPSHSQFAGVNVSDHNLGAVVYPPNHCSQYPAFTSNFISVMYNGKNEVTVELAKVYSASSQKNITIKDGEKGIVSFLLAEHKIENNITCGKNCSLFLTGVKTNLTSRARITIGGNSVIRSVIESQYLYIDRGIDYTGNKDEKLEIYSYSTSWLFIRTEEMKNKAAITCNKDASVYILRGNVFIRGDLSCSYQPLPLAITGKLIVGACHVQLAPSSSSSSNLALAPVVIGDKLFMNSLGSFLEINTSAEGGPFTSTVTRLVKAAKFEINHKEFLKQGSSLNNEKIEVIYGNNMYSTHKEHVQLRLKSTDQSLVTDDLVNEKTAEIDTNGLINPDEFYAIESGQKEKGEEK